MAEEVQEKKPNVVMACMSGFGRFLYNPDNHTVMGRGGASWVKIIFFYLVFYGCLAGFFSICLHVMLMTIPDDKPTVIGRTNKPYVAIGNPDLYILDFKKEANYKVYLKAANDLKESYDGQKDLNTTANWKWNEANLKGCSDISTFKFPTKDNQPQACFYMALNRIIDWTPELKDAETLTFECAWDIGKSGKGNKSPPFTKTMINMGDYSGFYPWISKTNSGLQPIAALHIKMDVDAAKKVEDKNLETWIKCSAMVGGEVLANSRSAIFRIKYSNAKEAEE